MDSFAKNTHKRIDTIRVEATVVVRGGGDVVSGTIQRLHRSGFKVLVLELPQPLVVRRTVAFAQAVVDGRITVEDTTAVKIQSLEEAASIWRQGHVPVLVDPDGGSIARLQPDVVVDGTMAKRNTGMHRGMAPITIALGPGFVAGTDVDVVIETLEGHGLGSLIFEGSAQPDTGSPVPLFGYAAERVLRAPCAGRIEHVAEIGDVVKKGDIVALVNTTPAMAHIGGVVRGLIQAGMNVEAGLKIGDVDPHGVQSYCYTIFDKARAIGGGVLEAILCRARSAKHTSGHQAPRSSRS
jgi:xanthine dehydrogenase accessory factor